MFDFNEDKLTHEQVMQVAMSDSLPPLRVAINANGYRQSTAFWGSIDTSEVYSGDEIGVLIRIIMKMARKGRGVVGIRSLYEGARKVKPFEGSNGIMARIKDELIPALEEINVACLIGDKIYVHPAIIDEYWVPNFKTTKAIMLADYHTTHGTVRGVWNRRLSSTGKLNHS